MMNMVKKAVDSKLIAVGVLILAVIFFSINLFSGSNPAEDTDLNQDQVATLTDNSWGSILIDNFWLFVIITILAIVAMNWFLKRKGATTALSWTLLSTLVTFIGILAFSTTLFIFMLIPGDIVAYVGTILMTILMIMIITSIVMLVTGWGSRLVWIPLLVGFIWLSYNPPETTAQQVAKTTATIAKGGLQTVAPDLVPNFIFETPAEARARIVAQAELDKLTAEGEARTRVAAENAAARAQDESMINANAVPCVRLYKDQPNCTTVTFGYNTKYERTDAIDHCAVIDPKDVVTEISLGGNQWRYSGPSGLVVQFFDVPLGKPMPSGKKCGE